MRQIFKFIFILSVTALIGYSCNTTTEKKSRIHYPNGDLLVSAKYLKSGLNKPNLVVLDVRSKGYETGHIPGAVKISLGDFTDSQKTLKSIDILELKLGKIGLSQNMSFVIYGDKKSKHKAARMFWMLEYLGSTDVHLLSGGWYSWVKKGYRISKISEKPTKKNFKVKINKNMISTTNQVQNALINKNVLLIDGRTDEEYNGWTFRGELRGGHIPGAIQIPEGWLYDEKSMFLEVEKLRDIFAKRGVTKDKEIIVYCRTGVRSCSIYLALRLLGYKKISNYDGSVIVWSKNRNLKMKKLPNYEKIVSAKWVKDLIAGKRPVTYKGKKYLILETRYMSSTTSKAKVNPEQIDYIPGAVSIHPCYFEHKFNKAKYYPKYSEPKDGNLLPPADLKEAIENLGISKDTTVIVYGSGVIIPMTSSRVAWALMYAGVKDVRILNGGYTAWIKSGGLTSQIPGKPQRVSFGGKVPEHPEYLATMSFVRDVANGTNKKSVMVDVRREKETKGKLNPYPFFTKKGKIPGAVWMGNWVDLVDMNDNTFRSYTEVSKNWAKLGITKDKEPVYYCGTGWRSSIGFLLPM
jgi:thiosulfate/3-mercaptopyruvate sulfurtransferase